MPGLSCLEDRCALADQLVSLLQLQPSQLYISAEKLSRVEAWFQPQDWSNFEPLPVKELDGRWVLTDGHTRAVAVYRAGLLEVPMCWEVDDLDWEAYRCCVAQCALEQIGTVADLAQRVVGAAVYRQRWEQWCDDLHAALAAQRNCNAF